ncbi:hypothetical protein Tco_1042548 [Tanacetum coccineum]|uniref:Uncharacterized protein n=1 Tax=Tanacetum coccineum TaxID=301880 RepID=A0ABQ5GJG3_9ASTR
MMDADYQMAYQLQVGEQEQLSIEEKSKLFIQLLEAKKKHFTEMRAREKRNKPPTQAQQRKLYCNYLKNMEGYTLKQLKGFKFEFIKDMFDKAFKRVNTFVDYKTELVEDDAKVDDDQEEARMKELINIVPDEEEVAIDAIPLATKPPCIGRIVGIKSFIRLFGITAALIKVSAAQEESTARVKLVLLVENEENILSSYYCLYTVNAAGV